MAECWYSIGPYVDAIGPALGSQSVLQGIAHYFSFPNQLTAAPCIMHTIVATWNFLGYITSYKFIFKIDMSTYNVHLNVMCEYLCKDKCILNKMLTIY